ncbi:hypothetical protein [Yersinia kristensenii]|uniref:hypothetical protein n=1 Tax=Yersinia kristensenii TaxID=28152 RepID=UPI0005DB241C|nr:hypothetical protein [Yersinia kristensenii]CFR19919.1 Uncharacterised protein [Yersinia kristensenii]
MNKDNYPDSSERLMKHIAIALIIAAILDMVFFNSSLSAGAMLFAGLAAGVWLMKREARKKRNN